MRVLITNLFVARGSGTEAVVEAVADGLRRRGVQVAIYAPELGPQAERMRLRGHILVDRTNAVPWVPDVIHAQHLTPALMAIAAFPRSPVLYSSHSHRLVVEGPLLHPNVRRYLAVDELVRQRCLSDGAPPDRLSVLLNPVDLERFRPRPPLPERPQCAIVLGKRNEHRELVQLACHRAGLSLEELGPTAERFSTALEDELQGADIVFAPARGALEAAVTGCFVVVCDGRGFAGALTRKVLDAWRPYNFGAGILTRPSSVEALLEAIGAYDPAEARAVSERLRSEADLERYVEGLIGLYRQCLAEPVDGTSAEATAALARLIEDLVPTPAERPWRLLLSEQELAAERTDAVLLAIEQRLAGGVKKTRHTVEGVGEKTLAELKRLRSDLKLGPASKKG
jgi:hypothetical protein